MKLYLVRHGQTNYNIAGLCNAEPTNEVSLTKAGIAQVNKLAEDLKSVEFQQIYISELFRTKQTAEAINIYHRTPVVADARLNDNRSGFEGRPALDYYAALDASPNKWSIRFNNAESIADVKARVNNFMHDLQKSPDDSVLIVTSKMIIQLVYGIVERLSYEDLWNVNVDIGSSRIIELERDAL